MTKQATAKKSVMVCFGDVRKPENGYTQRCAIIRDRLVALGGQVNIIQLTDETTIDVRPSCTIYSVKTLHEKKEKSFDPIKKILGFNPISEVYFQIESMIKLISLSRLIREADEVYIEGCLIISGFLIAKVFRKRVVLDTHCINKVIAEKLKNNHPLIGALRSNIWGALEGTMMSLSDNVIFVSENDMNVATHYYHLHKERLHVVENAVAAANPARYKNKAKELRNELGLDGKFVACFVGDLGSIQNAEAERFIREKIAKRTPDVYYTIIGRNPQNLPDTERIFHSGYVDSVDPYIIFADACIAPLETGSGTKTKMLDYMKYDKLILATEIGAEGLESSLTNKVHITEAKKFAEVLNSWAQA